MEKKMLFLLFLLFSNANAQLDAFEKNYGMALQGEQNCNMEGGAEPVCLKEWDNEGNPLYTPDCRPESFFPLDSESQCRLFATHLMNAWEENYGNYTDATFDFSFKVESDSAPGRPRCDLAGSNIINITVPMSGGNEDDRVEQQRIPLNILGVFRPGNPLRDALACTLNEESSVFDLCMCTAFGAESAAAELAKLPKLPEPATGVTGTGARAFADPKTWAAAGLASLVVTFASFA